MSVNTSSKDTSAVPFKTFPEFSKLTLADRVCYEKIIKDFPPIDGIQFHTLLAWWNTLDSCRVAVLNGNLVISYWLPGAEKHSGLSIIGTNAIDETFCTVFDTLREQDREAKVVHVPEFVIGSMKHPELFLFEPMVDMDEYVITISALYPLINAPVHKRQRVRNFLSTVDEQGVICRSLDLRNPEDKERLLKSITQWNRKGKGNDFPSMSNDAMRYLIECNQLLKLENVCLFVDGELQGCLLYKMVADRKYALLTQFRVNSEIPHTFEYVCYSFGEWLASQGVHHVNLTYDAGLPQLRSLKLSLHPSSFFRKYTVRPL